MEVSVGGEGTAVPRAALASERGEPAAGLFDDGHERRHIVGLQIELAHNVESTFG